MKLVELLKNILEENKHGFDVKSHTSTHFAAFEKHMADKAILSVLQNCHVVSC